MFSWFPSSETSSHGDIVSLGWNHLAIDLVETCLPSAVCVERGFEPRGLMPRW
jgi:hypothetical protein